jgi:hypothetical protein
VKTLACVAALLAQFSSGFSWGNDHQGRDPRPEKGAGVLVSGTDRELVPPRLVMVPER